MNCIFCKIINKEAPAEIILENNDFVAFEDIEPKAVVHILIVSKKHITSIKELTEQDKNLIGELILFAKNLADSENLKGYKLLFNVGRSAGQAIDHLHLHLLSGKTKELP